MALALEPYRHRIETGDGLCRSFTGTRYRNLAQLKGRVVVLAALYRFLSAYPARLEFFPGF